MAPQAHPPESFRDMVIPSNRQHLNALLEVLWWQTPPRWIKIARPRRFA
jgi:hypothetical protein